MMLPGAMITSFYKKKALPSEFKKRQCHGLGLNKKIQE
jgi:hypothetical protein